MTDRDEIAVFEDALIEDVAAAHDVSTDRLTELARSHQSNVRDLPGVDNIVYEWRNHFHLDPLLVRTEDAYYLALPDHVWEEFADDFAADDGELSALRALHEAQSRADAPEIGLDTSRLDGDGAVVLVRP